MSNLTKLEFVAFEISGKNYLSWTLDAEIHLEAKNHRDTIKVGNQASLQDRAKSMIFIHHHLHEELKSEYLTVKDPLVFWNDLKERYENQKSVILPKAPYNWLNLRLQDFKSAIIEQNIELLLKNHQSRLTGSTPFTEANGTSFDKHRGNYVRGRGRGRNNQYREDRTHNSSKRNSTPYHQKNQNGKGLQNKPSKSHEIKCYRCGMEGHWSRISRTPKHLVDLYQASIKEKGKGIETNFVDHNDPVDPMNSLDLLNGVDMTHLDVSDFFEDVDGNFDNLIGDENVQILQHGLKSL
ncbi:hypothetical protein SO802_016795 [Lithocarpus litseifolius]|uniref:CCHC-type domain-containing protein n=1 Tax=Lithocarpus litseifolius TaxID=425828 RepID=A0AAW2CY66_9ROSI